MKEIKVLWALVNKTYFCNFALVMAFILTMVINFAVQFQVENVQDMIEKNKTEISSYRDQISLLEVEWAYMTRPSRLRELSANYLKDNGYTLASQIKAVDELEQYYQANYESSDEQQVAVNF